MIFRRVSPRLDLTMEASGGEICIYTKYAFFSKVPYETVSRPNLLERMIGTTWASKALDRFESAFARLQEQDERANEESQAASTALKKVSWALDRGEDKPK